MNSSIFFFNSKALICIDNKRLSQIIYNFGETVKTSLSPTDVKQRATEALTPQGYTIRTTSETQVVYEDGRDVNWIVFVLLLLCIIVGAIIYYFLACKKHEIIVSIRPDGTGSEVNVTSTTSKSSNDGNSFLNTLPK